MTPTFKVDVGVWPKDPGLGHNVYGVVGGGQDETIHPTNVRPLPLQRLQVRGQQRRVLRSSKYEMLPTVQPMKMFRYKLLQTPQPTNSGASFKNRKNELLR
jgi:hypothetical protein